ncbi:hypothetical protein GV829_07290 [Sphingomonas lacunae]|uniref:Uncharacterized protein n=1 Tax=Sphingomonas lacunae TaxID=2698828 RepID=A0A6M4AW72_9SPHN|nr:hypothetical protein [Sphingomonas lacunae]QJQ32279.1 hypothetical protein GV829_07290 [Sphingomonas lacunae]
MDMYHNRQWVVMVRYKDEPGAGIAKQIITASSEIEALAMARGIYGNLLVPNAVVPAGSQTCLSSLG